MKKTFKKNFLIVLSALSLSIMVVGCSSKRNTIDSIKLENHLKNVSYQYSYNNQQEMLTGSKRIISVGSENIIAYDYNSASSMEEDAAAISKDGNIVGASMVEWSSKPHFYKKDTSIIQYIGKSSKVLDVLNKNFGNQFAGQ